MAGYVNCFIDSVSSVIASVQPTHASVPKAYFTTRDPIVTFITFSISDMWYAQDRLVRHSQFNSHGRLLIGFPGT